MESTYDKNILRFPTNLKDSKIIQFPKILDPRGNLSFLEENSSIPFPIERTYWIYDVPGGEIRGSHAFKESCELIVALSGSFDVCLNDCFQEKRIALNRSYYGLYIPKMLWRTLENFSSNSLALVLSSTKYDEDDYIRDYEFFSSLKKNQYGNHSSL
jgi:hypothetical protein